MATKDKRVKTHKQLLDEANAQHRLNMTAKWNAVEKLEHARDTRDPVGRITHIKNAMEEILKIK